MRQILCLVLITCVQFLLADETNDTYCFKYRWVEPKYDNISMYDCKEHKGFPCVEPLILSETPPNTSELWKSRNETYYRTPPLSNVCIKYTYIFDNKIVNTTLFFGKVIEEGLGPVTTGCYEQYVNGFTIRMCACLPRKGQEPCNMSVELKYSTTLVITLLLFISARFI
ncbi:uncharacterized protein LOC143430497 [Xylocopa sonorina]|uniref:uncharacterized protein LOC143430497 n=1 Tax=Xylocopa sonorina TaxID=1818115 RepID=UPI00403AB37C